MVLASVRDLNYFLFRDLLIFESSWLFVNQISSEKYLSRAGTGGVQPRIFSALLRSSLLLVS
jgi:hypothetical protein